MTDLPFVLNCLHSCNVITIEKSDGKSVHVAKEVAKKIELVLDSGVCFISGSSLIGKPEDRLARLH